MRRARRAERPPWLPVRAHALLLALLALGPPGVAAREPSRPPGGAEIRAREPQLSAASVILAGLPPGLAEQLHEERVVLVEPEERKSSRHRQMVRALVLFEQPHQRAFRYLAQTERQGEYRTDLKKVRTLRWFEGGNIDEHVMKILFVKITYRLRYHLDAEVGSIRWELDPDFETRLHRLEGSWELYELDEGRTLARFGTRVDAGPAVPGIVQDYATRKNVPRTLERVRRWVDSGGTWRP